LTKMSIDFRHSFCHSKKKKKIYLVIASFSIMVGYVVIRLLAHCALCTSFFQIARIDF